MSAAKRQSARAAVIFALALVVLGALVGLLTVALSVAVDGGASLFAERPQLVWLLPVAGLCSYGAYRAIGLDFSWSTARVMKAVRDGRPVPPLLAPAIIAGTALTVLCGGSVGKEAAALQMGAAASGLLSRSAPGAFALCWRHRPWSRSRRHAGCSVGGRRVLLRGATPKTRLACRIGCPGGDVVCVLGSVAGDGRAFFPDSLRCRIHGAPSSRAIPSRWARLPGLSFSLSPWAWWRD